jgi:hypothetical protein
VNTRLSTFAPLVVLAVIAVVMAMLVGASVSLAAQSPLPSRSPIRTPESHWTNPDECISWCEDMMPLAPEGWCTCWCGLEQNDACQFSPLPTVIPPESSVTESKSVPTSTPEPTPTPASTFCPPWWQELPPWMGLYELRYHDGQYCIGARLH